MLRALRAALDGAGRLPLSAGVDLGPRVRRRFRAALPATYSIKGDSVNLAARLMARAGRGDPRDRRDDRSLPDGLRARGDRAVPREGQVRAGLRASGRGSGRLAPAAPETALVGREAELGRLLDALGSGEHVEIAGEAGMGKSRLVDELSRTQAMHGWCARPPRSTSRPRRTTRSGPPPGAARRRGPARRRRRGGAGAPALAPAARDPARGRGEVDARRSTSSRSSSVGAKLEETMSALRRRTRTWAGALRRRGRPVAGRGVGGPAPPARRRCRRAPWLVVTTRRMEDAGRRPRHPAARAAPRPEAVGLVHAADARRSAPDAPLKAIVDRAGGNPLFLAELAAAGQRSAASRFAGVARHRPHRPARPRATAGSFVTRPCSAAVRRGAARGRRGSAAGRRGLGPAVRLPRPQDGVVRFHQAVAPRRRLRGPALPAAAASCTSESATRSRRAGDADRGNPLAALLPRPSPRAGVALLAVAGDRARSIYANAEAADLYVRALGCPRGGRASARRRWRRSREALGDVPERLGLFRRRPPPTATPAAGAAAT